MIFPTMKLPICSLLLLTLAVVLTGCASSGHELDQNKVSQIKKGVTTKTQVLELVGKPEEVAINDAGESTWTYRYTHTSAQAQNFIPIVGAFDSGYDTQVQTTTVTFTTDGIVKSMSTGYGGDTVNAGVSAGGKPNTDPK